jgi:hypothetical protein
VVASQVIFQGPEQVVVWRGGANPDCRVVGSAVPSRFVFLCTRKQTGTNFPIPKNLRLLDHMVPTLSCVAFSLNVILGSCLTSSSTFCLLRSVAAGLGGPQRGWSAMSVFPSLKCFTHADIVGTAILKYI